MLAQPHCGRSLGRHTSAQTERYPDRAVKVVVGYAADGGPAVQVVAQQLSFEFGQQFFVENRLGRQINLDVEEDCWPGVYAQYLSSAPTPVAHAN